MTELLSGAIAMGWLVAGLYFFRFWRHTRDRFFLYFALSFWLECAGRIALGLEGGTKEDRPVLYAFRVLAYGLILLAIWQKNRPNR
ncbi:MAG: putative rane protein [Ramlibacter sp.]|jgi:hypothetical protein|nr:putative rane protein [Ramlibacter sp.]